MVHGQSHLHGNTLAFLGPKNQEDEFGPSSTFWRIIHSFIHLFVCSSNKYSLSFS